ncbi:hypothetical protein B9G69_006450 [Bdellovibrio sp. SKB1291214]|uniref:hypothetical protein n=1 Tax=Bdellovibrio sp. SKB1291214 TaxID=1732569 RepID=UPI000B51A239|nr:hypothetical protein [Bdellovibrio sp. SKB1291214]UYL10218.1 hypothetical protein B9G69_006450 [Bdellovibrio sp. SKB1291214]
MNILRAIHFFAILFLGFVVFAASPEEFLHEQKMIRVYVDSAPGFGHQSAGVSVMRRLRDLGFKGEFEVVYQPSVASKIQKIYPGFPEGISGQVHYVDIVTYMESVSHNRVAKVPLAISGADDGFGDKFKNISQSEKYLRLQPLGWGEVGLYSDNLTVLKALKDMPLANFPSNSSEEFLKAVPAMNDLSADMKYFVQRFADSTKTHFSFPIYGVGTQMFAPQRMYFYAKAVKAAALKMDKSKAIVVPVVSPFNAQEMDTMSKVFGKKSGFESSNATELKHQKQMHLLTPQEFSQANLKPGNVYFVFVGSVPQTVFNFFYEKATLPVWVAGKNAMSFAVTKGKPYFNTVDDYYLPGKETLSPATVKVIDKAQTSFSEGYQKFMNQTELAAVSQYIQAAATPDSELSNYFKNLGAKMSANDRVLEGLRYIVQSPSIPACSKVFQ